jgi:hypothetical protein
VPQGEHAAKRVADHPDLVKPECVYQVLDHPAGVLAYLPAPEGDRVGQAVIGEVHGEEIRVKAADRQPPPSSGRGLCNSWKGSV